MKSKTLMCITATILFAALALASQVAAQGNNAGSAANRQYIFIEVPTLGGPQFYDDATGAFNELLNNTGTFTGGTDTSISDPTCLNDCFAEHAMKFRDGVLTDLGTLPGGINSQAFWINPIGVVVGFSENGVMNPLRPRLMEMRAAVWSDGKIISIGTFGGTDSMAQAINNRGQVVGFALNAVPDSIPPQPLPTQMRAFLWENGVLQNLGTLGGPDSWTMFVNDGGQVAGVSYPDSNPSSRGVITDA